MTSEGIKVIQLPKMPRIISFLYPKALIKMLRAEKVDVLNCHSGCWYKAVIAGKFAGVKGIVYTEHGRNVFRYSSVQEMTNKYEKLYSELYYKPNRY